MDKYSRIQLLKRAELIPSPARTRMAPRLTRAALLASLPFAAYGGYKAYTGIKQWNLERQYRQMLAQQQQ